MSPSFTPPSRAKGLAYWTVAKRTSTIVLIVAAVLGGLVAVTQLVDWTRALLRKDNLTARVAFGIYRNPPVVERALSLVPRVSDPQWADSTLAFLSEAVDTAYAARLLDREAFKVFQHELLDTLVKAVQNAFSFAPGGYWLATVSNTGSSELADVRLTLPHAEVATITRPGLSPQDTSVNEVVFLRSISPRSEVAVLAWTNRFHPPDRFDGRRVALTHRSGVGRVSIGLPVHPVDELDRLFWSYSYWITFAMLLGALLFSGYMYQRSLKKE